MEPQVVHISEAEMYGPLYNEFRLELRL